MENTKSKKMTKIYRKFGPVQDHLGNQYNDFDEMCAAYVEKWDCTFEVFERRFKEGWDLEHCLKGKFAVDHLGNEYKNKRLMAYAYGITYSNFTNRIRRGFSIEEALTVPVQERNFDYVGKGIDYQGVHYETFTDLCEVHNRNIKSFSNQLHKGGSVEKALKGHSKKSHVGETAMSHQGQKMTIIDENGCKDCTIQFEDGMIVYHKEHSAFLKGQIKNPNLRKSKAPIKEHNNKKNYFGITGISNDGYKMVIIESNGYSDIAVRFEDGLIVRHKSVSSFKKGSIAHKADKN